MNASSNQESTALALSSASAGMLLMDAGHMGQIERIADLMSSGKTTIPQHLRGSKADCFAVALQSMQWGMNPFAVAQKTHISQSGALNYESQLISAAITESGAVEGAPAYEFLGDWDRILGKVEELKSDKGGKYYVAAYSKAEEVGLGVVCRLKLRGESEPREMKVMLTQCYPRFSTQWATDPKQQICYVAIRKWSRLYAPGVILGVYSNDEIADAETPEKHMGMADVVAGAPGAETTATVAVWPDDALEKRFPKYREFLTSGKTHDEIIAFAESKGALTDAQKKRIRELKPLESQQQKPEAAVTDVAPKATYAEVASQLYAAASIDALNEAADLISAVADEQQRAELAAIYDKRVAEINTKD